MQSVAADMIGGFNQFIKKQKENDVGECRVSFNQFDDVFENVYSNIEVKNVQDLTDKTFVPRNYTALYDAVGRTIDEVGKELSDLPEGERPEKVWVVILTDGLENASKVYTQSKVRGMITEQQQKYNWDFTYIGANQDTWAVGQGLGISQDNTYSYVSKGKNTTTSNATMWDILGSKAVSYRSCVDMKMSFTPEEQKQQEDLIADNKNP
jgi:hypothetical protein